MLLLCLKRFRSRILSALPRKGRTYTNCLWFALVILAVLILGNTLLWLVNNTGFYITTAMDYRSFTILCSLCNTSQENVTAIGDTGRRMESNASRESLNLNISSENEGVDETNRHTHVTGKQDTDKWNYHRWSSICLYNESSVPNDSRVIYCTGNKDNRYKGQAEQLKLYLTIKQGGRLGNLMFKYAALFAYSRRNTTWIPVIKLSKHYESLWATFGESLSVKRTDFRLTEFKNFRISSKADVALRQLQNLPKTNLKLIGLFESYKFFFGMEEDLRKEFTFPERIRHEVLAYYRNITPDEWRNESFVRVGIHVRRTDLVGERGQRSGYVAGTPGYFSRAMDYFKKEHDRVQFIVASDDLDWCRENIVGDRIQYSVHDYILDLAILALADHVITTIGTYSWWAGWLCRGTTIYYDMPPPENTYFGNIYSNNSWIPPTDHYNHWVPIK